MRIGSAELSGQFGVFKVFVPNAFLSDVVVRLMGLRQEIVSLHSLRGIAFSHDLSLHISIHLFECLFLDVLLKLTNLAGGLSFNALRMSIYVIHILVSLHFK